MKWLVVILFIGSFFILCDKDNTNTLGKHTIVLQNDCKSSAYLWIVDTEHNDTLWGIADSAKTIKLGSLSEGAYHWRLFVESKDFFYRGFDTTGNIAIFVDKNCWIYYTKYNVAGSEVYIPKVEWQ